MAVAALSAAIKTASGELTGNTDLADPTVTYPVMRTRRRPDRSPTQRHRSQAITIGAGARTAVGEMPSGVRIISKADHLR